MSDAIGEPHADKNQDTYDNCGDGVHFHAIAKIVVAIPAFIFFEAWDERVARNAVRTIFSPAAGMV